MNPHQVIEIFKRTALLDEATADELLNEAITSAHPIDEIMVDRESLQDLALDALSIPVTIIARSEWSLIIERHDLVVAL